MFERLLKLLGPKSRGSSIIEDVDLKISSEYLCCPVCMDLFSDSPYVIPCGHTLCRYCLNRLTGRGFGNEDTFDCPICRKKFLKNRKYPKNYMVESILSSIDDWVDTDANREISDKNFERIAAARWKKKFDESEAEKSKLKAESDAQMKRYRTVAISIIGVAIGFFVLFRNFVCNDH